MKKDHCRDYATAAFRMWALKGCPTREEEEEHIKKQALAKARNVNPEKALLFVDAEIQRKFAELNDIDACVSTFELLNASGKEYISKAVYDVYMYDPQRELRRGEISSRVLAVAVNTPCSEKQVYIWLSQARELFAEMRGLRRNEND